MDLIHTGKMTTSDGHSETLIKAELEMMRSSLNFSTTGSMDDHDPPMKKCRQTRDPMSHRIIEKRRRDRMNNCLADLSQLIPQHYMKQGQGRIEKTEIIEMAISHIQNIKQLYVNSLQVIEASNRDVAERFWLGYKEAMDEVMRFLVEKQNYSPTHKLCVDLQNHLQAQSQQYKPADSPDKKISQDQMLVDRQGSSGIGSMVSDTSSTDSGNRIQNTNSSLENNPEMSKNLDILKNGELPLNGSGGSTSNAFTDVESGSTSGSSASGAGPQGHDGEKPHCPAKGYKECRDSDASSHQGYNFKKYIKQRFTKATSSISHPDSECRDSISSSCHNDLDNQHMKDDKKLWVPSPGSESTASPYPASEYSLNSGNGSNENMSSTGSPKMESSSRQQMSSSSGSPSEEDSNWPEEETSATVPGFALHPNATYYIPIVINTNQLLPYMKHYDNMSNAMRICHPVSIPVNFGAGHFMSYPGTGQLEGKHSKKESSPRSLASSSRTGHSRISSHSSRKHKSSPSE